MVSRALVSVVDDDESVRESLPGLLDEFGFEGRSFASAEEFLASHAMQRTQCLILDIARPATSGPKLKRELNRRRLDIPTIFITGQGDDNVRAHLIRQALSSVCSSRLAWMSFVQRSTPPFPTVTRSSALYVHPNTFVQYHGQRHFCRDTAQMIENQKPHCDANNPANTILGSRGIWPKDCPALDRWPVA
jgi:CheY-like chemotaxis protein